MRYILTMLAAFAVAAVFASGADAQALWKSSKPRKSLFSPKAEKIEVWKRKDLVQVVINERLNISRIDALETTKESELDAALERYIRLSSNFRLTPGETDLGFEGDASFETSNEGSRKRRSTFSDTIMCEVVEVMPGYDPDENRGQLMIRGRKSSTLVEDTETLEFTGRIDIRDINLRTRSVESSRVFDLKTTLITDGDVSDAAKQGWMSKMLNTFWPF